MKRVEAALVIVPVSISIPVGPSVGSISVIDSISSFDMPCIEPGGSLGFSVTRAVVAGALEPP